jgi:hypothetical protein
MKSPRYIALALISVILASPSGIAAEKHGHDGSHGGQVRETAAFDLELTAKDKELALYVKDHSGKKVDTKGATATATVMTGKAKETVKLAPAGDNVLKGLGSSAVTPERRSRRGSPPWRRRSLMSTKATSTEGCRMRHAARSIREPL